MCYKCNITEIAIKQVINHYDEKAKIEHGRSVTYIDVFGPEELYSSKYKYQVYHLDRSEKRKADTGKRTKFLRHRSDNNSKFR